MKSLAEEIIEAREAMNWSQQKLATAADVSLSAVTRAEAGVTKSGPAIKAIRRVLRIRDLSALPLDLMKVIREAEQRNLARFDANIEQPPRTPHEIPEWESEVGAGHWVDCITAQLDVDTQRDIIERGRYIIRIRGDSMEPIYRAGDRVLFRIVRLDQEALRIGADYCFQNSDGQCSLKRLHAIDDDEYTLAPLNPRYEKLRLAKQLLSRISIVETIVRAPWE